MPGLKFFFNTAIKGSMLGCCPIYSRLCYVFLWHHVSSVSFSFICSAEYLTETKIVAHLRNHQRLYNHLFQINSNFLLFSKRGQLNQATMLLEYSSESVKVCLFFFSSILFKCCADVNTLSISNSTHVFNLLPSLLPKHPSILTHY